ncbi:CTP synthase [Candidatus Peribacteria bacterium]|nr:CTP synthase [Candidatus Peribacteria bacterium]
MDRRYLFVVGGVCSSLGKGICAASIATILRSAGVRIGIMKLDPYLNIDPGTMSPYQHGEVFVLNDGAETDLDLGYYERFTGLSMQRDCSVSAGKIYQQVLQGEREGSYLGGTIQVVPHITDAIQQRIEGLAEAYDAEVMLIELGGTVGDIEADPFLEAVRRMKTQYHDQVRVAMLGLVPYLQGAGELKTKPMQLAVRELNRRGLRADLLFARADKPVPESLLEKISLFADIEPQCVIPAPTVESIYAVPLHFDAQKVGEKILEKFGITGKAPQMHHWKAGYERRQHTVGSVSIGLAGKYVGLDDAYKSVIEALESAAYNAHLEPHITWIDTEKIEMDDHLERQKLASMDCIVVPGGFGIRGIEGKIRVAQYCRERKKPYLGLCLGSQILAIEYARNVLGMTDATSEEFDEEGKSQHHIVHFIPEQRTITDKGGTMRLGAYDCLITPGTLAHRLYGKEQITERHRHRYEINTRYTPALEAAGLRVSGWDPSHKLPEIVEVEGHPYMIASQFHPEFISSPFTPHPLFAGLIAATDKSPR